MATGRIGTTPVLQVRWSKAPSAGTTSLSGLDDNSVSLVYSVGYEAVYRNGVLLSRTNDYTATDGTTITLIDATIAGDIIEVFANQTIPLADTYSQTVANGKFINNTLTTTTGDIIYASAANTPARLGIGSTDQVLKVSGGIPAWGAAPSGMTLISRQSFSNVANTGTTFDNVFSSTYKTYQVVIEVMQAATSGNNAQFQLLRSGTTQATSYTGVVLRIVTNSTVSYVISPSTNFDMANDTGGSLYNLRNTITLSGVGVSGRAFWYTNGFDGAAVVAIVGGGYVDDAQTYTGILFKSDSSNITGTVAIYGLAV